MQWLRTFFDVSPPDELAPMRPGFSAMMRRALATGTADEGLTYQVFGCSVRGEPLGDWEFTVRRVRPAPVDATPRKAEGFEVRRAGSAVTAQPAGAPPPSGDPS